ncbi:MAG: pantoate--beta-alanine ligase [Woeseiaceae bacterium]|nr:pantoate--beta-alanine ligase [Woeseiaceae bacterium]
MDVIEEKDELHELIEDWLHHSDHVALVPTMGNLHAGHLSLVELARENAERVIVSIFVNPTQFDRVEDFDAYPRSLEKDCLRLRKLNVDAVFAPQLDGIYPFGLDDAARVVVPSLKDDFCGARHPGYFDGVTGLVARLFALVQPDVAVFGQKDFQEQLIVRRMTEDLNFPTRIITAPTIREDDGLAMSSRNQFLSDEERAAAPELYAMLSDIASEVQDGQQDYAALEEDGRSRLSEAGFDVDYVAIRRAENMQVPDRDCDEIVVLAAAMMGKTRLLDNVVVTI